MYVCKQLYKKLGKNPHPVFVEKLKSLIYKIYGHTWYYIEKNGIRKNLIKVWIQAVSFFKSFNLEYVECVTVH